jgi:uncharacterized protein (TIGR02266 family)
MIEPRQDIRLAIYYGVDQQELMTDYTVNVSTGGVFIEADNILPVDTSLEIKFKLPDNDIVISCNARVAWTNEPGQLKKDSLPPGMGIQFLDLSLDNLQAIRNFLKEGDLKPVW